MLASSGNVQRMPNGNTEAHSEELIPIGHAARLLGRSVRTLRLWDASGKLVAHRDPVSRQRFYHRDEVLTLRPRRPDAERSA